MKQLYYYDVRTCSGVTIRGEGSNKPLYPARGQRLPFFARGRGFIPRAAKKFTQKFVTQKVEVFHACKHWKLSSFFLLNLMAKLVLSILFPSQYTRPG